MSNEPKLNQNVRWGENYVSQGLNRKLSGLISPGIYKGFEVKPAGKMRLLIDHGEGEIQSVAVVERDGYNLTIVMEDAGYIDIPAIGEWFICVEAFYTPKQIGYERIVARENVDPHHVILAKVTVEDENNEIESGDISYVERQDCIQLGLPLNKLPDLFLFINVNWDDYTEYFKSFTKINFEFKDKVHSAFAAQHRPDANLERWVFSFFKQDGTNYPDISLGFDTAKNRRFMIIDTPELSDVSNTVTTCSWINQKFGTSASLIALATLDKTAEDYVETLEIKKQKAVAQINAEAQQAIYSGFPYEIDGHEYFISYSLFDQQNLASRAIIAMQNPGYMISIPVTDETGHKIWLDVSTDIVLEVHKHGIVSHTGTILKQADEKKKRIMTATTEQEINSIVME